MEPLDRLLKNQVVNLKGKPGGDTWKGDSSGSYEIFWGLPAAGWGAFQKLLQGSGGRGGCRWRDIFRRLAAAVKEGQLQVLFLGKKGLGCFRRGEKKNERGRRGISGELWRGGCHWRVFELRRIPCRGRKRVIWRGELLEYILEHCILTGWGEEEWDFSGLFWSAFSGGTRRLYLLRKGVGEETARFDHLSSYVLTSYFILSHLWGSLCVFLLMSRRLFCLSKEENLLLIFVCLIIVFSRMSCILVAHGIWVLSSFRSSPPASFESSLIFMKQGLDLMALFPFICGSVFLFLWVLFPISLFFPSVFGIFWRRDL